ncbi:MAG: LrgB family protein [Planctomycetes bacterium]|nr:LrgB family protein [Planctomycetota bacterium]
MTADLLAHPFFGLALSIAAYAAGSWLRRRTGSSLANPLLVAAVLVAMVVRWTPFSLDQYRQGGAIITLFIIPATTVLALPISRQWAVLRANAIPILGGCAVGSMSSLASVWCLCRVFALDDAITASLLPKSVTTAIAMELAENSGGIASLAVSAVILTGLISAIASPLLIRLVRLDDPVARGVAIGVSGHAVGTARALEMGETEGALSGIALGVAGILTSVLYLVLV